MAVFMQNLGWVMKNDFIPNIEWLRGCMPSDEIQIISVFMLDQCLLSPKFFLSNFGFEKIRIDLFVI